MKKYLIIIIALFFCFPLTVFASGVTDKLYIDIKIMEDGDLFVRELAALNGSYNGRLRTIDYRNLSLPSFTGKSSDFGGSDIYNASSIKNVKVYDVINKNNITFNSFDNLNYEFKKVNSASSGDYGVYTLDNTISGIDLKIFNPSSRNSAFYIEYEIEDAVVVHQDVAELAWNILGNNYQENIEDLIVQVHLPNKDSSIRVWGHGPLNGTIERTDDQIVTMKYDFLGAYNPIDLRIMFDKDLVPLASKQTNVYAQDKIFEYEKEQADKANQEREKIRLQNNIIKVVTVIWFFVMILTWLIIYLKYDKEHKVNFTMQYYRDFPGNYGPEILEYLMKKHITTNGFSASILNIVYKKALKLEEIIGKRKEYKFVKVEENIDNLTQTEKDIVTLLINEIGNGQEVRLKEIKNYGKNVKKATKFMEGYQSWVTDSTNLAKEQQFFVSNLKQKLMGCLLAMLGIIIGVININFETEFILWFLCFVLAVSSFFYFLLFFKRTEKGALEYQEWKAFKRFLMDFGRMDEKTLPEVRLWERYLIYATVLGCAKKLEKEMKIKLETMNLEHSYSVDLGDIYVMNTLIRANIASTITSTVNQAVVSSRSSIASSAKSSSGGFGGGMSSGGGSFGGGGGGGRF